VHDKDVTDAEAAPSSFVKYPAPTASADDVNDANKGRSLDRAIGGSSSGGDEAGSP
jgi:hypothetical protein